MAAVTVDDRFLGGRVAWVTGGGSGIGKAIALALARHGANVAIGSYLADAPPPVNSDSHQPSRLEMEATAASIVAYGVEAFASPLDVRQPSSVELFHRAAMAALGPIDMLVNAAAIGTSEPIAEHDDESWRAVIDTNLNGAYRTIKCCLPGMFERRWGRIVNIASTAANVGYPGSGAYCASKAGLLGLTRCVALEGAPHGVSCNAINPGQVDTPSTRRSYAIWAAKHGVVKSVEDHNAELAAGYPQRRLIQAGEIAALVAFLCREEAFGITAEDITISGGTLW